MKPNSVLPQQFVIPRLVQFYLSRGRLLELMNHATENKLTLVSAPPGYGKTSLLIDFAGRTNYPVCWYSLESTDNKLIKFVEGFTYSIQQKFPKFGIATLAAINSGSTQTLDAKTLSAIIINDLLSVVDEHFLIFLDDFQLVDTNSEISDFVNNVLVESDENLHMVISSRELLGLPDLPLLVARSQVGGLSYEELSFTKQEIKDLFLLIQKRTISDSDAELILRNCEGWVMGLLLSSQIENGPLSKVFPRQSSREIGINNFLALQVLDELPVTVQLFLLRSSLFERFDASSFSHVMKEAGIENLEWQKSFNYIVEHNLFIIPSGDKHTHFRYHNLFLEFLRGNMNQRYPEESKKIQLALAEYYEEIEEWGKAFNLYNALGEVEKNVRLIEKAAPGLIAKGRINEVEEWLISIPKKVTEESAPLLSTWGAITSIRGNYKEGLGYLDAALKICESTPNEKIELLTLSRKATNYRLTGEYENAISTAMAIREYIGYGNRYSIFLADALFISGTCNSFFGKWELAQNELNSALGLYKQNDDKDAIARCELQMGYLLKSIGQYQNATTFYKRALNHYQETKNIIWEASVLNNMGILGQVQCDLKQSFDYFEKAFEYAKITRNKRSECYLLASIGDLYSDIGTFNEALDAYDQAIFRLSKEPDLFLSAYLFLAMAKTENKEDEITHYIARAKQQLLLSPNKNLLTSLEFEESVMLIKKGSLSEKQNVDRIYKYFLEKNQLIDLISILARLCVLFIKYPNAIDLRPFTEKIRELIQSTDFKNYFILLLQRYNLSVTEISDLPIDYVTRQKIRLEWAPILECKSKARIHIRRRGNVVPLRPAKITIHGFGKTQISRAEKPITMSDWKTQIARDLFIFLAINHQAFTKEEIGEIFWPESTLEDLKLRFKNTIYRLRNAIGKDVILFDGDRYEINRNIDIDFDYDAFLEEANAIDDQSEIIHKNNLQAIKIYKGPFLRDIDMPWADQVREELGQKYFSCLLDLSSKFLELEDYENSLKFSLKASEYDPISETAYQLIMRSLGGMGDRSGVIRHFQKLTKNLFEELAIEPSAATVNLYKLLIR